MNTVLAEVEATTPRWHAVVTYRTEGGPVDVPHDIEELDELQGLVERGPHWGAIESIVVRYVRGEDTLTVEEAEKL